MILFKMDWLNRAKNLAKTAYGYYNPPKYTTLIGPEDNPQKYYYYNTKNQILGEGLFGTVYKGGENKQDGKNVVIKKLKKSYLYGIYPEQSFKTEVECLKRIKEFCQTLDVICFEDAFKYQNEYYIVTPLLEGYITLYDFIVNPIYKINSTMVDTILSKLKSTLEILHDNGIRHNDLHLGNIMIEPRSGISFEGDIKVKIIDFGLCTETKPSSDIFANMYTYSQNILEKVERLGIIKDFLVKKARETSSQVKPLRKYGGTVFVDKDLEDFLVVDYAEHVRTSPKNERKSFQEYLEGKATKQTTRRSPPGTSVQSTEGRKSPKRSARRSPTTVPSVATEGRKSPKRSPNSQRRSPTGPSVPTGPTGPSDEGEKKSPKPSPTTGRKSSSKKTSVQSFSDNPFW